ncbi:MAG: 3-dehydroquinate synthase [Lentisphaerae bacterium]|nr:3-dehydroquinate synthase [Lentisphaerota bacterium]
MVDIRLGARSYTIRVGTGMLDCLSEVLHGRRGLVVTDSNVDRLYGAPVMLRLGPEWGKVVLPAGEATKSAPHWSGLLEQMAQAGLDRQGVLVALGGGVVGDLTGFAAASYMRGIGFVQAPTTLLAMVDSSVGGKTGINLAAGKNLAGAFHQPLAVLADTNTLATLPGREFAAGMAEVVKYAVALDAEFFGWLEQNADAIQRREPAALEKMVVRCCEIKAGVVAQDEREAGRRAVLNFGHTLGHALEKATGYSGLLHGEAVALGMPFALACSIEAKGFSPKVAGRVVALLHKFGLNIARLKPPGLDWRELRAAMERDKKAAAGAIRFVLCDRLGHCGLPEVIPPEDLDALLKGWCQDVVGQ